MRDSQNCVSKKNYMIIKGIVLVICLSILMMSSAVGCNKSEDELSSYGKSNIDGSSTSTESKMNSTEESDIFGSELSMISAEYSENNQSEDPNMSDSLFSSSTADSTLPNSSIINSSAIPSSQPTPTVESSLIPNYPVVTEDSSTLNNAVAAWDLADGGVDDNVDSALSSGKSAIHKWGVWLRDMTFGTVLDFSTEGSYMKASGYNIVLGDSFTISLWAKAPKRENQDRVLMYQSGTGGSWSLQIDKDTRKLSFRSTELKGNLDSGKIIGDGLWHHIQITYDGSEFVYYVDGKVTKAQSVSGEIIEKKSDLWIGSSENGEKGFDGSISRVRIYDVIKEPSQTTQIKVPNSANEMQEPLLKLKKGLVLDRRQYSGPVPPENEKVYTEDIQNVIDMGFDHIKILLTPNHIINSDGTLKTENMTYITRVLNDVTALGLNCILCLHPEVPFKQTYLVEGSEFEKLIRWYGDFATYIGKRWSADQVAIQLMTEPYANSPESRWTWMSDRAWGAVRNVLPDHTIITSSDRSGNLERLKLMSPATDSNLIYSFTTYEPYTIGFNIARTGMGGKVSIWNYMKDIPYPADPSILDSDRIEDVISLVPSELKDQARNAMQAYASGVNDGGDTNYSNYYLPIRYSQQWHLARAKSLDDWRNKYGGNIHIMCVEFGCMDKVIGVDRFQGAEGAGLSDETRIRFVKDLRTSFEAYDIGWSYWSYNEAFTVFLPDERYPGFSPDPETLAYKWYDYDMLETALGLKPKR